MKNHHLNYFAFLVALFACFATQAQTLEEASLERKLAHPDSTVFLPFTLLAHVENAELPKDYSGWVMKSDFKKSNNRSVIIIEMNSSDLMDYDYSSGSVQLIIEFPHSERASNFDLGSKELKVHQINNYGGFYAGEVFPTGRIRIEPLDNKLKLTGDILLETNVKPTRQMVHLDNCELTTFSLDNFLLAQKALEIQKQAAYDKMVDELVNLILNDTIPLGEKNNSATELTEKESDTATFDFKLVYRRIGLGSNQFSPSRIKIEIRDSILSYGIMELSDEIGYIDYATGDTTFKNKRVWYQVPFPKASRDSIVLLLKPLEGQELSISNPNIMSGAINEIYFENSETCAKITMNNAFDETANQVYKIIDSAIPEEYHLYRNPGSWFKESDCYRTTTDCTGDRGKTKKQLLEEEYDAIRNRK